MAKIRLSPTLAGYIGSPTEIDIEVTSVGEAVRAIRANYPLLDAVVSRLSANGIGFVVRVGNQIVLESQLDSPIAPKVSTITITAQPCGSGGNQIFGIIAGIALIGLGLFSGGIGFLGMSGMTTTLLGGALLLGALFGQQKSPRDQEREGRKSNIFSRPQQTFSEGGRLPILYGVHLVGWTVISALVTNQTN
jgi:predicted phage tail protein